MPEINVPAGDFFYYYHNWIAGQDNEIHKGKCPKCNHGFGQRETQIRGKAGVWIGPFESVPLARKYIIKFLERKLPVRTHECP